MSFWDIIWFIVVSFVFIAYLMILFNIIADMFRDHRLSGGAKAVWLICLVFLPFLTAIVYLITRGSGMAGRQAESIHRAQDQQAQYIRSVSAASPADEIAKAKDMLDSGAINQAEFEAIKQKALA